MRGRALWILIVLAWAPAGWADDPAPRDRHAFAAKVAKVSAGQSRAEVREQLGAPDAAWPVDPTDANGRPMHPEAREVWGYGTRGPRTFATLSMVVFDRDGNVLSASGGAPCKLPKGAFEEHELEALLRLMNEAPSYNRGHEFDPVAFVRVVNALRPHGKDHVFALMREFVRIASVGSMRGYEGLYLVLRGLFEVPEEPGYQPPMYVGAPNPSQPKPVKNFPRFPLVIRDDVPFLIVSGYTLAGVAERLESQIVQFEQNGVLRKRPMEPGSPEAAGHGLLEDLANAVYDPRFENERGRRTSHRMLVASQVRRAKNLDPIDWRTLAGTVESIWGTRVDGLRIRAKATRALEVGLPLRVTVELDGEAGARVNPFLYPGSLTLRMEYMNSFKPIDLVVTPYDPTAGMPTRDEGDQVETFDDGPVSLDVDFPLVTKPELYPGRYTCTVIWTQAGETRWMDADTWKKNGFWKGTVRSAPFDVELVYPYPVKRRLEVPTRLRLTDDLTLVTHANATEEVLIPVRNGFFVGTQWSVGGEMFMLRGLPHDPMNPVIADLKQRKPTAPKVTYTVEVFETSDPPMHMWMPGKGSGGYKVLFRRDYVIAPTPEQLKRLGLAR